MEHLPIWFCVLLYVCLLRLCGDVGVSEVTIDSEKHRKIKEGFPVLEKSWNIVMPLKIPENVENPVAILYSSFFWGGEGRWGLLHSISGTVRKCYKLTIFCME